MPRVRFVASGFAMALISTICLPRVHAADQGPAPDKKADGLFENLDAKASERVNAVSRIMSKLDKKASEKANAVNAAIKALDKTQQPRPN
jgi:hypothetical protein